MKVLMIVRYYRTSQLISRCYFGEPNVAMSVANQSLASTVSRRSAP
jgi:hypothetical protein